MISTSTQRFIEVMDQTAGRDEFEIGLSRALWIMAWFSFSDSGGKVWNGFAKKWDRVFSRFPHFPAISTFHPQKLKAQKNTDGEDELLDKSPIIAGHEDKD